eukprot:1860765-Alexandrium_andersonii.AAC.1
MPPPRGSVRNCFPVPPPMPPTAEQRERGRSYADEWREHRPRSASARSAWRWQPKAEPEEPQITIFGTPQKAN